MDFISQLIIDKNISYHLFSDSIFDIPSGVNCIQSET